MKKIFDLIFQPKSYLYSYLNNKDRYITYIVLIATALIQTFFLQKNHFISAIFLVIIVLFSIYLEAGVVFTVLKMMRIKSVTYMNLLKYLLSTAYLGYSIWTFIFVLISFVFPQYIRQIITIAIDIYKLSFICMAINLQYALKHTHRKILVTFCVSLEIIIVLFNFIR